MMGCYNCSAYDTCTACTGAVVLTMGSTGCTSKSQNPVIILCQARRDEGMSIHDLFTLFSHDPKLCTDMKEQKAIITTHGKISWMTYSSVFIYFSSISSYHFCKLEIVMIRRVLYCSDLI